MARVDVWGVIAAFLLYAFSYAMFGLAMHRWFFPHKNNMLAGVFGVSLPALWAIVPMVALPCATSRWTTSSAVSWEIRSICSVPIGTLHWEAHFWCALAMAGIAIPINLGCTALLASFYLSNRAVARAGGEGVLIHGCRIPRKPDAR